VSPLIEHKSPRPRFARSINVERDAGTGAVESYLPVSRAIDAINRLAMSLDRDDAEVAISITGPYGSGKSSLAVVIDALLGPKGDPSRLSAEELLSHTSPEALERLRSARARLKADRNGFIRAIVTAQREPITRTVVRALLHGARRFQPASETKIAHARAIRAIRSIGSATSGPDARQLRKVVAELGRIAPVLVLIDEFGKNLEAFADSQSGADLFLLQELAEWSRGSDGLPLALVTLQHMAFDEYADAATVAQRREWAKIQGRFEDVPFVDSPAQTRALVAAAFGEPSKELRDAQVTWSLAESKKLSRLGLTELAGSPELLANCWPLHPISLAALPELCERYGQNERTLFSFLAGHEPRSVAAYLEDVEWNAGESLPVVRLDRLYDYFIEAAANLASVSSNASRWLEVDTRVRDAVGLAPAARRVLKTVGLLNLVSAGGTLRASRAIVGYAVADGNAGSANQRQVEARLDELEAAGLVTFRDFADEYRVWHGSDFDLRKAVDLARRRLRDVPAADVLNQVLELGPLVAARHSHITGTLRAFDRAWVTSDVETIQPLVEGDLADGLVLYTLGDAAPTTAVAMHDTAKPMLFVTVEDSSQLVESAREVAAIDEILGSADELRDDWVARRELHERRVEAVSELDRIFHATYGAATAEWTTARPGKRRRWTTRTAASASAVISDCCDDWYSKAPVVRNDLVNRHELSSQAAKARRLLLEAMIAAPAQESLAIEGNGPDYTLYLSLLATHGLHRELEVGLWGFTEPYEKGSLRPVWDRLMELLSGADTERLRASDIYKALAVPPYGLRVGLAPIVLVAALVVASEEVALYEHGTFRPVLTDDILERLLRNPSNFEVKHFATRKGVRSQFLTHLADTLHVSAFRGQRSGRVGSVLAVVSSLVTFVNGVPEHVRRTRHMSPDTVAVRQALMTATEPDELLFTDIPTALRKPPIPASRAYSEDDLLELCDRLRLAIEELRTAYSKLLDAVHEALREHVGPTCTPLRDGLAARARELEGKIIEPRVAKLAVALTADIPEADSWLAYVAMNVTGVPPEAWTDEDRRRFFVTIADTGGTFRRIHALNANLGARGDGFDAYRSVITRSDGAEVVHVVAIDAAAREAGEVLATRAVVQLAEALDVGRAEARSLLVGLLGEADFAAAQVASGTQVTEDAYGGDMRTARP
jgi:hypothetical protein